MEQKHRSEFPEKELWDLTAPYQDREDFCVQSRKLAKTLTNLAVTTRLSSLLRILKAFAELEQIYIR